MSYIESEHHVTSMPDWVERETSDEEDDGPEFMEPEGEDGDE